MSTSSCKKQGLLTQGLLMEILDLKQDGRFYWKVSRGSCSAGTLAGNVCPKTGYRIIGIRGKRFAAHRLAILWETGRWPTNQVTHFDLDRDNNNPSNLIDTTRSEIMQSRAWSKGPLPKGVRQRGKYFAAKITVDGRGYFLGSYPTVELAEIAYKTAKQKYHTILEKKV